MDKEKEIFYPSRSRACYPPTPSASDVGSDAISTSIFPSSNAGALGGVLSGDGRAPRCQHGRWSTSPLLLLVGPRASSGKRCLRKVWATIVPALGC